MPKRLGTHWRLRVGNVDGGAFDLRALAAQVGEHRILW